MVNSIPKITISNRQRGKDDPTPFQADAIFPDGRDYHALGASPVEALLELAKFWAQRDAARFPMDAAVTISTTPITADNLPDGPRWEMDGSCWKAERCEPHPITGKDWRWVPLNLAALWKTEPGSVLVDHYPQVQL